MKHRDIFRVPARIERRSILSRAWKVGDEVQTENEDLGWFIIVDLAGKDFAFYHGPDKPLFIESTISLVLEYMVPDAQP